MRQILLFLFSILPIIVFSQIEKFNKTLKIENLEFKENEIRIYKDYSTSTGLEMFRFFEENEKWKADFYETIASKKDNQINIRVRKTKLNSLKNLELIWLEIVNTDVLYLPKWDEFKYKLRNKKIEYEILEGEIVSSFSTSMILDGVSYYVQIKSGKNYNEFNYHSPESYLKEYPNVDELKSFNDLLELISKEFKIFTKN